jgi:four helix bundle protein
MKLVFARVSLPDNSELMRYVTKLTSIFIEVLHVAVDVEKLRIFLTYFVLGVVLLRSEVGSKNIDKSISIADRTKAFAIRIIKACSFLDEKPGVCRTREQLLRSGTSIGANVHESRSAQSDRDFLHKMEIALKEARETEYWLEILIESEVVEKAKFSPLLQEADEIVKILVTSTRTIKQRLNASKSNGRRMEAASEN